MPEVGVLRYTHSSYPVGKGTIISSHVGVVVDHLTRQLPLQVWDRGQPPLIAWDVPHLVIPMIISVAEREECKEKRGTPEGSTPLAVGVRMPWCELGTSKC